MAGIFCASDHGETLSDGDLDRALGAMDYRGPDGARRVAVDHVHLGHQHFRTTPERTGVGQPVRDGDAWLALDGRLDNRAELVRHLDGATTDDPDPALLLSAYRAFGEAFVERVVGAFGVVVYDAAAGRLVVARDRVGRREVFYGQVDGTTVVASDRTPVLACLETAAVEERRLAEYLTYHTFTPGLTCYDGVRAVPPGHYAVVEDGTVDLRRYWQPGGSVAATSEAALVERLARRSRAAVSATLRTPAPVGTELSGGMDSTTVTGVAADLVDAGDLAAYSLVFEEVGGEALRREERGRIADVVAHCGVDHRAVAADDRWPRPDDPVYDLAPLEGPCRNATAVAFRELYRRAAADGRRVLLSGEGGNFFDGKQSAYADLVRRGRPLAAIRSMLRDETATWRLCWLVVLRLAGTVGGRFPEGRTFDSDAIVSDALRAAAEEPVEEWPAYPQARLDRIVAQDTDRHMFHGHFLDLLGFDRRVALAAGVDLRHPLLDPRLVDLAYSLPVEYLFGDGERKYLFRQFAADYLPERVHRATATPSFTPLVTRGLAERREQVRARLRTGQLVERGYVDARDVDAVLSELYGRPPEERRTDPSAAGETDVWRLLAAEEWLRDAAEAGVFG